MRNLIYKKVESELNKLISDEVKEINIKQLVAEIYGRYDYFLRRSFDVMFCNLRKNHAVKLKVVKGVISKNLN